MTEANSRIMTLPTLALRGVSVFPGTVLHFEVERPMSIAALNAAIDERYPSPDRVAARASGGA